MYSGFCKRVASRLAAVNDDEAVGDGIAEPLVEQLVVVRREHDGGVDMRYEALFARAVLGGLTLLLALGSVLPDVNHHGQLAVVPMRPHSMRKKEVSIELKPIIAIMGTLSVVPTLRPT